jgi:hypothetical protein
MFVQLHQRGWKDAIVMAALALASLVIAALQLRALRRASALAARSNAGQYLTCGYPRSKRNADPCPECGQPGPQ